MTAEEWRPVVGFEGFYEVSSFGVVRGITRIKSDGRTQKGVTLKGYFNDGYRKYILQKNGAWSMDSAHRIVLAAFVGPCPDGFQGCHNDGNRSNNSVSNLRWDSRSNNAKDKVKHGTHTLKRVVGEQTTGAKISERDVIRIREARLFGATAQSLANVHGLTRSHINRIVWRQSWAHI